MPRGNGKWAKLETARITTRVSELYLTRKTMREIAAVITQEFRPEGPEYTPEAVYKHIKKIRAEWRASRLDNYDAKVDMELCHIDQIEREAWLGWERSIGMHTVHTTKTTTVAAEDEGAADIPADEITEKKERLAGDPRFLDQALKCVIRRCQLLGLDAPTKTSLQNPDGTNIAAINVTYMAPPVQQQNVSGD